jgi:hypothetical protein
MYMSGRADGRAEKTFFCCEAAARTAQATNAEGSNKIDVHYNTKRSQIQDGAIELRSYEEESGAWVQFLESLSRAAGSFPGMLRKSLRKGPLVCRLFLPPSVRPTFFTHHSIDI